MLEKILKKASWSDIIISLVFVIFGFLLAYHPNEIASAISIILGGIFIAFGIFKLVEYNSNGKTDNYLLGIGAVAILAGIVIMFCSGIIMSIFRIIVGVWIIYTGIMNLHTVAVWKDYIQGIPGNTDLIREMADRVMLDPDQPAQALTGFRHIDGELRGFPDHIVPPLLNRQTKLTEISYTLYTVND